MPIQIQLEETRPFFLSMEESHCHVEKSMGHDGVEYVDTVTFGRSILYTSKGISFKRTHINTYKNIIITSLVLAQNRQELTELKCPEYRAYVMLVSNEGDIFSNWKRDRPLKNDGRPICYPLKTIKLDPTPPQLLPLTKIPWSYADPSIKHKL